MEKVTRLDESLESTKVLFERENIEVSVIKSIGSNADHWPRRFKEKIADKSSLCVSPKNAEEVSKIMMIAKTNGLRITTIGLGSSVVGCFDGGHEVYLSTQLLNEIENLDPVSCQITAGAGVNGGDLQQYLLKRGFELGQTPQSLYISTVGGWVNTRAIGGLSTLFGGVERVITGLQFVLASGEIVDIAPLPRASGGLDPIRMLIGTEGSLAVVTKVTLAVYRQLPTLQVASAFNDFSLAIEAQRQLVQGGFPVALLRAYNSSESAHIVRGTMYEGVDFALLNFTCSAPSEALDGLRRGAERVISELGGRRISEDAVRNWYMHRYEVETMMEDRNREIGQMFDTVEISLNWSNAAACAQEIERKLGPRTEKLYAHFSHSYQTGSCLYVIFWLNAQSDEEVAKLWAETWEGILEIVKEQGGSLSHHHGIGAVRSARYQSSPEGKIHARVKTALDPDDLLFARLLGD